MNRARYPWWCFGLSVLLALAALGWITRQAVGLERVQQAALQKADFQEQLRLAMWRLEFAASSLVQRENARDPSATEPCGPEVVLYFRVDAEGRITAPPNHPREEHLRQLLLKPMPESLFSCVASWNRSQQNASRDNRNTGLLNAASNGFNSNQITTQSLQAPSSQAQREGDSSQMAQASDTNEALMRQQSVLSNNYRLWNQIDAKKRALSTYQGQWIEGELFLARSIVGGSKSLSEGVWLNWPQLQTQWLGLIQDLLPQAQLAPVSYGEILTPERQSVTCAALPIRLMALPPAPAIVPLSPGLLHTLWGTWVASLVALAALALLLQRTLALSERRATFVSAVTHELRTPLTTFQLYTEMLTKDMIPDPAKRTAYLETLHQEAGRLNHLVENVLSFARLERGSARSRIEQFSIRNHLGRLEPRLAQRAAAGHLVFTISLSERDSKMLWKVDITSLEQILLNLVDNAVKYARGYPGQTLPLELSVRVEGSRVSLALRDYGPGIGSAVAKNIFTAFHKSADAAAHSAPGVGLGLSLSRRLARQMGGNLRFVDPAEGSGALFCLELPLEC
jgi:signal transduction histidine kinase